MQFRHLNCQNVAQHHYMHLKALYEKINDRNKLTVVAFTFEVVDDLGREFNKIVKVFL
jgi:hypothetical protein